MITFRRLVEFVLNLVMYVLMLAAPLITYYTTPHAYGLSPIPLGITAPATHVILMVADGLRADELFHSDMTDTPFIKNILLDVGVWGISRTRVPTESRSTHLAMFGGFYEDFVSVTNGWRVVPIDIDTIFNRSLQSAGFGFHQLMNSISLDPHIHVKTVSPSVDQEDLIKTQANLIDHWILDKFMVNISNYDKAAHRQGHMTYLHLEAADLIGHGQKPGSVAYREMVRSLDKLVNKVYDKVKQVGESHNARVAFILTSDHGMTSWGSHGAGADEETTTPLLIWGSGIQSPQQGVIVKPTVVRNPLGLPQVQYGRTRIDLKQADLCPLMATLLGASIPTNSVGLVPFEVLDMEDESKLMVARANAKQLLTQLQFVRAQSKASHFVRFFKEFHETNTKDVWQIQPSEPCGISNGNTLVDIEICNRIAEQAIRAMDYYHHYDFQLLRICIGSALILWIVMISSDIVNPDDIGNNPEKLLFTVVRVLLMLILSLLGVIVIAFAPSIPISHTVSELLPICLALILLRSSSRRDRLCLLLSTLYSRFQSQPSENGSSKIHTPSLFMLYIFIFGFMTFASNFRPVISGACILVGIWPWFDKTFGSDNKRTCRIWLFACTMLAIFPLLRPTMTFYIPKLTVLASIVLTIANGFIYQWMSAKPNQTKNKVNWISNNMGHIMTIITLACSVFIWLMQYEIVASPFLRQCINGFSWSMFVFPTVCHLLSRSASIGKRLYGWLAAVMIPYILLTTSYEIIFLTLLMAVGFLWMQMETRGLHYHEIWSLPTTKETRLCQETKHAEEDQLNLRNARQALFSIFFYSIAMFGSGQVASLSGYDPRMTFCFSTLNIPIINAVLQIGKVLLIQFGAALLQTCVEILQQYSNPNDQSQGGYNTRHVQFTLKRILLLFMVFIHFLSLQHNSDWEAVTSSISHFAFSVIFSLVAFVASPLSHFCLSFSYSL